MRCEPPKKRVVDAEFEVVRGPLPTDPYLPIKRRYNVPRIIWQLSILAVWISVGILILAFYLGPRSHFEMTDGILPPLPVPPVVRSSIPHPLEPVTPPTRYERLRAYMSNNKPVCVIAVICGGIVVSFMVGAVQGFTGRR